MKTADVVVNNFRAGVMDRMGFGYEALSKINPRIICAFGSGFGQSGPLSHKGGQDILAQALTGVMARKPDQGLPTSVYATALADYSAGMHLVQGILLALMQREKTGVGQSLSVSLYDSMLAMQMQEAAMWLQRKRELNWGAFPLTGVFETTDGAVVIVGAFKANPLQDICRALGLPDLSADPNYATFAKQAENKAELHRLFRSKLSTDTTAHWLAKLEEQDLLCAPVQTLGEALAVGADRREQHGGVARRQRQRPQRAAEAGRLADHHGCRRLPAAPCAADPGRAWHGDPGRAGLRAGPHRRAAHGQGAVVTIRFDVKDHVARVTIDRPDRMNAIDEASEAELMRIWAAIEQDEQVRCVVLTGAGERAFCTGADMKQSGNKTGLEYWAAARPGGFGGLALRETLDVPVIARVNGHALGGGMEMVLGCDIVVAAENASFGLPEPRVGRLALDGGIAILPRRIPHVWAMGMLLTGRRVPAAEALRLRPGQRGRAAGRARRGGRSLDRRHPGLRAALGEGDQADGAPRRRALAAGGAEAAPAGPGRRPSVDRSGRGRTSLRREARAAVAGPLMTYVVTSTCIDVKDGICQKVCPVECIYEGGRMMYIQPDECINCGICVSVCPVQAIYEDVDVPAAEQPFVATNTEFFGDGVTGWGAPGGVTPSYVSKLDTPLVRDFPVRKP